MGVSWVGAAVLCLPGWLLLTIPPASVLPPIAPAPPCSFHRWWRPRLGVVFVDNCLHFQGSDRSPSTLLQSISQTRIPPSGPYTRPGLDRSWLGRTHARLL